MRPVWFSLAFFKLCVVYVPACAGTCEQVSIFMCQSAKEDKGGHFKNWGTQSSLEKVMFSEAHSFYML